MRGASPGRGEGGEPHQRMQVLGPESQSRGCQPGSGSVPRAPWFPLTDVPTAPREGGKGTREGRCLAPLTPKPQWPEARWPPARDPDMGPPGARLANPPIYPRRGPPAASIDPLASPLTPGRLRLWFALQMLWLMDPCLCYEAVLGLNLMGPRNAFDLHKHKLLFPAPDTCSPP